MRLLEVDETKNFPIRNFLRESSFSRTESLSLVFPRRWIPSRLAATLDSTHSRSGNGARAGAGSLTKAQKLNQSSYGLVFILKLRSAVISSAVEAVLDDGAESDVGGPKKPKILNRSADKRKSSAVQFPPLPASGLRSRTSASCHYCLCSCCRCSRTSERCATVSVLTGTTSEDEDNKKLYSRTAN